MQCEYKINDLEHYATNLRKDSLSNTLKWDSSKNQSVLIVQTKYGDSARDRMNEICMCIEGTGIPRAEFREILPGISIRFVSVEDNARQAGCPLNGEASTYTVFACIADNERCVIFDSNSNALISSQCDIPLEVHIDIVRLVYEEGALFWKKEVESEYWEVRFPSEFVFAYADGDLRYQIANLQIPITKQMVEKGFYIKSSERPAFISMNKGLSLI